MRLPCSCSFFAIRLAAASLAWEQVAALGRPGQPDLRARGEIELRKLIVALLLLDIGTRRTFQVDHRTRTDEFLTHHRGPHPVQAIDARLACQLHPIAGNDKGRAVAGLQRPRMAGGYGELAGGSFDRDEAVLRGDHLTRKDVGGAEELRDETGPRLPIDLLRAADLFDPAAAH